MNKFEIGKVYMARSMCNHDCIYQWRIVSRTAKTITVQDIHGLRNGITHRCKVYVDDSGGVEMAWPEGHYSMAPIMRASREAA